MFDPVHDTEPSGLNSNIPDYYDAHNIDADDMDDDLLEPLAGVSDGSMVDDREVYTDSVFTPVLVPLDLDDLLAESVAIHQEHQKGAFLRKELAKATTKAEREALQEKIRQWEDTFEWKTQAYCLMVEVSHCVECDTTHEKLDGFFYHQTHRKASNTQRWVRTQDTGRPFDPSSRDKLPRKTLLKYLEVSMCACCAMKRGFDISAGEVLWTETIV